MDETDLFLRLTPDWVIRAVEAGGFEPTGHCFALHCFENRVYDLKLEDDSHVVVKFYRPGRWSREAIQEEHRYLFALQDVEIPVCAPLRFADGDSIHEVEGIYYAVWPRTGGRSPDELHDEDVAILGRLVARIHGVGKVDSSLHRGVLNGDSYGREPLQYLESNGFLPPQWKARYQKAVMDIAELYDARARGVPMLRIHGDCHRGNLLKRNDKWFFLDFDDFLVGPPVQDVWMLVPSSDEDGQRQRKLFIEAYRDFGDFEASWLDLVEPLRGLRYVHYATWIARRWRDPAFKNAFPYFNTEEYWERQTIDLEQQLRQCGSSR